MAKNFHNGTNIIEKLDNFFLGEDILEFLMAPTVKRTLLSWRRRFQSFDLEPKSSGFYFDRFKTWTLLFRSP